MTIGEAWTEQIGEGPSAGSHRWACCGAEERYLAVVKTSEIRDQPEVALEIVRDGGAAAMQIADPVAGRCGQSSPERVPQKPLDLGGRSLRVQRRYHYKSNRHHGDKSRC